jgi:hypothetical protein
MKPKMTSFLRHSLRCGVVLMLLALVACRQEPQKVRHISQQEEPDSALMAQMAFNMKMAGVADRACSDWVKQDSLTYAQDDFGFWYSKTIRLHADTLQKGEVVLTHIQVCELNGTLLADIQDYFPVGSSDLPIAINRSLKQMSRGEEMRVIAPWYTAYGAEGTALIKPYSNLIITLTTIEE